jgi:hypothetical protein
MEEGVFVLQRTYKIPNTLPPLPRLTLDFEAAYETSYWMIPAVSYNGNHRGNNNDPKGYERDGVPWSFASHRSAIPGGTYSEGDRWSVGLFSKCEHLDCGFSCSLIPRGGKTTHRLIWPEEEMPVVFIERRYDTDCIYTPGRRNYLFLIPGQDFSVTAYLVVIPLTRPKLNYRKFVDTAWKVGFHETKPKYSPQELWGIGVRCNKETMWDPQSKRFFAGLSWSKGRWVKAGISFGWAGRNGSIASSLMVDYLRNHDKTSLEMALACLDSWAAGGDLSPARGPNVAASHLHAGVVEFLKAYDLARKCGVERPEYRRLALEIADYAVDNQKSSGELPVGKEPWADNIAGVRSGKAGSALGCYLAPALVAAYEHTKEKKYLQAAIRGYDFYISQLHQDGYLWGATLDTACADSESAYPLLEAAIRLHKVTDDPKYLEGAEDAAYYHATWQYAHTVDFLDGTPLARMGYDTFGANDCTTVHPILLAFSAITMNEHLELARLTGNDIWRQRAKALWDNGTIVIADGRGSFLSDLGVGPDPFGTQNEGYLQTNFGWHLPPPVFSSIFIPACQFYANSPQGHVYNYITNYMNAIRLDFLQDLSKWDMVT